MKAVLGHAAVAWRGWADKRGEVPGYFSKVHRIECPGAPGSPDSLLICGKYVPSEEDPPAELYIGTEALAVNTKLCAICHGLGKWREGWKKRRRKFPKRLLEREVAA